MIGIIVLAGGLSRRMGQPKLLLPWSNKTILRTVVETALQAQDRRIKVVVNPRIPQLVQEVAELPVEVVVNHHAHDGMSTSLRAGIEAMEADIEAVMVLLADQPMMTPEIVNRVISEYRATKSVIVQASFAGEAGHPVLFDRALFSELLTLSGDQGAKAVIEKYRKQRQLVHFAMPPLKDIDTKEDYWQMLQSNFQPPDK
jgi:molybdenum cofactor cytidylyltransferase